ncbi:MAG: VWA domain-containing protein [Bryobacteraceae bacterium]
MFAHPYLVPLALIPLVWAAMSWRRSRARLGLLLKAATFSAILLALSEPAINLAKTRTATAVLVDTSASISDADLARATSLVHDMYRAKGGNWIKIVPFDSRTRALPQSASLTDIRFDRARNGSAGATDFENALFSSMSALPADYIPRLALISDGNENQGSSARAIAQLQRLHVPVDTFPLSGHAQSGVSLQSLSMPDAAYAGEQIPIDLTVSSPVQARGSVELSAEGKSLGTSPVMLNPGSNVLRVHARVNSTGVTSVSGRLIADGLGELPFEGAVKLKRAKVLYLSQDPAGADANLLGAFGKAEYELSRDASQLDKDLASFQLVVLNNLDLESFSESQKSRVETYVRGGGGLLLIGGERQVYKEDKQMDALDRVLPAKLAPPRSPEGTCVALIIDKSSSMEGRKIELARLSAVGVVDHLRPADYIGVLIFDNSFQWAVPVRKAEDKSLIRRLISGITPDGGTQIAPALTEAYKRVLPSKATYKHIVLLTDGISEEGDSIDLAKEAYGHQITISTVGLGQDVNRAYLERVANASGGRSYFLNDPQGLEQILLKDVKDFSGSTTIEKPLTPIVAHEAEILQGVGMDSAPPLKGYARFSAKPSSDVILNVDPEKKDPLYVRWQYGLGRAAVFTSDAKSRWAEGWVTWPGFDKFWINATRDLLAHTDTSEASARYDTADTSVEVSYRIPSESPEPASIPEIFILGPNGFQKNIPVRKSAPRVYSGTLRTGKLRGVYRIRPVSENAAFPEIGLYRPEQEFQDRGSNEKLLRQIASFTGGRYNPAPSAVFESGGRSLYQPVQFWPALLGLAIALTIGELVARKWAGLTSRFRRA